MLNRNSLFWKIFSAVWLANLLVIGLTTYIALNTRLIHDEQRQQKYIAEAIAENLSPYLDRQQPLHHRQLARRPFRILDEEGKLIFNGFPRHDNAPLYNHTFTTPEGQRFILQLPPPREPRFLHHYMKKIFILRMLFVLIISGLVSYLLTRMITRPLKALGEQTQAIAQGDLQSTIDNALLERKDEIGDLARESEAMLNSISQLLLSQQRLLHDVSHELRAPLARLMAALGLIQQREEDNRMLQRIEHECDTMNTLIEQILQVARIDNTQARLSELDITPLLKQCIEDCRFEFPEHNLVSQNLSQPFIVKADPQLLSMAINNILRNGCQHTPAGTQITLSATSTEQVFTIKICDNGPGIEQKMLENLFTPFYRNEQSQGFGLGLNISQRVMEKHQGSIHAQANHPQGLCFILQFPG